MQAETIGRRCIGLTVLGFLVGAVEAAAAPPITGSLETIDGVRVLRLWGTPHERGFAHGFLAGEGIVELFESAVLDPRVLPDPKVYEGTVRRHFVGQKMRFDPKHREELQGLLDGIVAAQGPAALRLKRLGRNLDLRDLEAVNTLADWYRFMCSSFSAWGDGEMVTARNLDFMTLSGIDTHHLIIVYLEPAAGRKRWVSLAWSGLIGAYTAMNEEGVTISMHDARGRKPTGDGPFVPRSLALREAIETAGAGSAVEDVQRLFRTTPTISGNNIHVSAPYTNQPYPAAVFEYDGDLSQDGGVTVRLPRANPRPDWIVCTNHYVDRSRTAGDVGSDSVARYETIAAALRQVRRDRGDTDFAFARQVMADVSRSGTLQTVVFFPNRREVSVQLATPGVPATGARPVRLRLADLFRR